MFTTRGTRRRTTLAPLVSRAVSDRVGAKAEGFAAALRQPGEPVIEPPRAQPGSPQVTEAAVIARMASALRHLPSDYLSIDWRRNKAYIDAELTEAEIEAGLQPLTDAEIEAPGHDAAALRAEYIRRNGMIALDSCAAAAWRGARDALNCVPPTACPYDDPALASEWRRGYRDMVAIVGDDAREDLVLPFAAAAERQ